MDPVLVVIAILAYLFSMLWTTCWGLFPPLIAVIVSYYAAKYAAAPILAEAKRIERHVYKAAKALGAGKNVLQSIAARKGGSVRQDPIGDFISEKTGGLFDMFRGGSKTRDPSRVDAIVQEEAAKHGFSLRKKTSPDQPDLTPVK